MKSWSWLIGIIVVAALAALSLPFVSGAAAAPAGAATGLKATAVSCSGGLATYRLSWTPSGKGAQRVDLSYTNNGFASNFSSGNFGAGAAAVNLTSLKAGATYYVRVVTFIPNGVASDTLAFKAACETAPAFSVPSGLNATEIGKGTVRFQWTRGTGNNHFCLDTATSAFDLMSFTGSWRNHGCGTTATTLDVYNLPCGTVVYWRVFAWGTGSGHSQMSIAITQSCALGQPHNLQASPSGTAGAILSWTPGLNNRWFCVDIARSPADLAGLTGTWTNHGCWMTGNLIQLANLQCGATYYWNVFAWNEYASTRSATASFEVTNCQTTVKAPIEEVAVAKSGSRHYAHIVAALPDACHTPASHSVQRSGNTFTVNVLNHKAPGQCAFVYTTYDLSVNLGSDLTSGQTYKVVVNGAISKTFVAQ